MSKERKIHINFDEALIAATSGVVFGTAVGSAKYLGTPLPAATRIALTCIPLVSIGAIKVAIRTYDERKQNKDVC